MQDKKVAVIFLAAAAILWSSGGLLIKMVNWNPIAISGFRSGIAVVVMLIFWYYNTGTFFPKITKYKIWAGLNYVCLVTSFVVANKYTSSANAILLQFTAPAWVLLFSIIILKEKVVKKDVSVVIVVFVGMTLFFTGDLNSGNLIGNFFGLLSGISMGLMIISMKKIKDGSPLEIVILGNLFAFLLSWPFFKDLTFDLMSITGILLLGIFQLGIAYILFTSGITKVSALEGILIPVLEPLLNPVWVLLGTGETPGPSALLGGVIVISAVVYKSVSDLYQESCQKV